MNSWTKSWALVCFLGCAVVSGCSSDPESKDDRNQQDSEELRRIRASDKVKGYDGKPIVRRMTTDDREPQRTEGARLIVYVTESIVRGGSQTNPYVRKTKDNPRVVRMGRSKKSERRVKALVLTDGLASQFVKNFKESDFRKLKGSVKPVPPSSLDGYIEEMTTWGLFGLKHEKRPAGKKLVDQRRAIHIYADGQITSIYKHALPITGVQGEAVKNSPRGIFTRCEHLLIQAHSKKN